MTDIGRRHDFSYRNEYVLLVSYPCVSMIKHAERSEQKGPGGSEAKSFLKESCIGSIHFAFIPGFLPCKRDEGNPGVTAIQGFSDHGVTLM
jgi:hypothetical protein